MSLLKRRTSFTVKGFPSAFISRSAAESSVGAPFLARAVIRMVDESRALWAKADAAKASTQKMRIKKFMPTSQFSSKTCAGGFNDELMSRSREFLGNSPPLGVERREKKPRPLSQKKDGAPCLSSILGSGGLGLGPTLSHACQKFLFVRLHELN